MWAHVGVADIRNIGYDSGVSASLCVQRKSLLTLDFVCIFVRSLYVRLVLPLHT